MATTDLRSVINQEFDSVHYTKPTQIKNGEDKDQIKIGYGYVCSRERIDRTGKNSGYNYKQGDAFSGDHFVVACIGRSIDQVQNLIDNLLKICDEYDFADNTEGYIHMYIDNANNILWDIWPEGIVKKKDRRKADVRILLSKNNTVNYTPT